MNRQVSYNWLKEYVKLDVSVKEFAKEFSLCSQSVERIEPVKPAFKKVVTAKITAINPHPDADRLRLATVEVGKKKYVVVCGAPNIKVGQIVPLALVGATVMDPKTGAKITLTPAVIRGVKSNGMLCAPDELGLGQDHSGILVLPPKTPTGKPLEEVLVLDDHVLDIEVTTNRPDAMATVGLAQEAAAVFGVKTTFKMPQPNMEFTAETPLSVEVVESALCPRYQAVVMTGVTVAPSPIWMQLRLTQSGIRPINNLVDITNYVLLEYGQPMHVFDYDKLNGKTLVIRNAKRGEKILALDGNTYNVSPNNLIIADSKNPVAVAGVMGGEKSAVSDATTTLVFECANFAPAQVRKTARALNLHSESSGLFEKGLHQEATFIALLRAIELTQQLAGGKVGSPIIDIKAKEYVSPKIVFDPASVVRYLGVTIPPEQIKAILESLGFVVAGATTLRLTVPWQRANDIKAEHDIVEEVARIYGYHNLPARLPIGTIPRRQPNTALLVEDTIKDVLVAAGFSEIYNNSMVSKELLKKIPGSGTAAIKISNPLNEELEYMRTLLMPQLLQNVADNLNNFSQQKIFELSNCYVVGKENDLPLEVPKLVGAVVGYDNLFLTAKGLTQTILEKVGVDDYLFVKHVETLPYWQLRQALNIMSGKHVLGHVGVVSQKLLAEFGIDRPVVLFILDIATVIKRATRQYHYEPVPPFPSIERDIAMVFERSVDWQTMEATVAKTNRLVRSVRYLSTYTDTELGADKKSIALRLIFRDDTRTLRSEEVDGIVKTIISKLQKTFNAVLR